MGPIVFVKRFYFSYDEQFSLTEPLMLRPLTLRLVNINLHIPDERFTHFVVMAITLAKASRLGSAHTLHL